MHLSLTVASGLLGTALAAPHLRDAHLMKHEIRDEKAAAAVADGLYARSEKWGHAKMAEDCPTPSAVVSTMTVDVTVYVTEPCPEETAPPTTTTPCPEESATTTPCPEETATTEPCPEPTTPCPEETSWSMMNGTTTATLPPPTTTEPCDTTSYMAMQHWNTSTPCDTETAPPTTTEPCPEPTTPCPDEVTSMPASATTTDCIIDLSMTPVSKATLTHTPTASVAPSKTVCAHDGHTGTPSADSQYCGIKGLPVGDYFIAEFVEDRPGVPVTEEGCYQFCDSVMQDTRGCESYRFFTNELGAPRCDLYGMPVSRSVKDIDNKQSGAWYDIGCGSPTAQKWHVDGSMPASHNTTRAN